MIFCSFQVNGRPFRHFNLARVDPLRGEPTRLAAQHVSYFVWSVDSIWRYFCVASCKALSILCVPKTLNEYVIRYFAFQSFIYCHLSNFICVAASTGFGITMLICRAIYLVLVPV